MAKKPGYSQDYVDKLGVECVELKNQIETLKGNIDTYITTNSKLERQLTEESNKLKQAIEMHNQKNSDNAELRLKLKKVLAVVEFQNKWLQEGL